MGSETGHQGHVLVTGAGRGIGKAIVTKLAEEGWKIALHYNRDKEAVKELAAQLGSAALGIYQADLSDPSQTSQLWSMSNAERPLDALVNNAGIYQPIQLMEATDEVFENNLMETFAVNFESPLRLARLAARDFAKRGGGKILNVASRVGFKGESGACLYSASKAALINLTRSLAVELAPKNIKVFGIAPGWVETAMAREGMETRLDSILADIPLRRMASPQDCAEAGAFLLSQGAEYLSGVVIDINGASYFH